MQTRTACVQTVGSPWVVGMPVAAGGPGSVALPVGADGTAALRRAWGAGLPLDTGLTPSHLLQAPQGQPHPS